MRGADSLPVWGSGNPRREFLHVGDLADGAVHVIKRYSGESHLNIGTGEDITIADLARLVAQTVGFTGELAFDASKPDGAPRKLMDVSRLNEAGWRARIPLAQGLADVYRWFLQRVDEGALRGA